MIEALTPDVIARAQRGDKAVISGLYERYRTPVFRYLYYWVGDVQTAEDITSDVFLRMLRSINGYRFQNVSFEAWIFQIARNLAIDHHRKFNKHQSVSLDVLTTQFQSRDSLPGGATALSESAAQTVERNLTSKQLVKALALLKQDQHDVIVLRFISELPIAQVAQALHKSEDSIKGLQRRALIALREILSALEKQNDEN